MRWRSSGSTRVGVWVYARAWNPPPGGTIDHRAVLAELLDLCSRFRVAVVAFDPAQIHGLVLDALRAGLPMLPVSQASGRAGGTMARHAAALVEALHERRIRLFPDPELRQHIARSRFSARAGADRLVKRRSSDKIDLAIALTTAVGVRTDLERELCQVKMVNGELRNVPLMTYQNVQPWGPLPRSEWEGHFRHDSAARPG